MMRARCRPALPILLPALSLVFAGCATRRPLTYQLNPQNNVLTPPGVKEPIPTQAKLTLNLPNWKAECAPPGDAITVETKKNHVVFTIDREKLVKLSGGWLSNWTTAAEAKSCLARNGGADLALEIVESIPIEPGRAYRLLHADNISDGFIDLGPQNELQVVAPIVKEGTSPDAPLIESVSGNDHSLNLAVRSSPSLLGYETSWYAFRLKPDGGTTITPTGAERNIAGKKEKADAPLHNPFAFPPEAGYYRMFYKTDPADNGITEVLVAGVTPAELEVITRAMLRDNATCEKAGAKMCAVIPRQTAVNPFLHASVNGADVRLNLGASVRLAVLAGGGQARLSELPNLVVMKPYKGKLTPIDYDKSSQSILNMVLLGGESISWTKTVSHD